jgi:hypothetical protein
MIIAIDFDGTCVTHDYPRVGKDIGAVSVLKELVASGHQLMLWTMRGNKQLAGTPDTLQDAVDWFRNNNIPLWAVNENPDQKKSGWSLSNKQYAELYIDDAALGCPLLLNPFFSQRPFVNWEKVREYLVDNKIITTFEQK